jgi:O-antigen/teichoic acid export membrane protein
MLFAYVVVSTYKILLLMTGSSIYWFAISQALDYCMIAGALLVIYKRLGGQRFSFSLIRARQMFDRSRYYIVSSLMVTVFAQTDRVMLKMMIDDAAVGYYSAAVVCAGMTSFVFAAIIDSARPSILEKKKANDIDGFEQGMTLLYSIVIYLAMAQSVVVALFSKLIVNILYGVAYVATVPALQIVVWYTTFSYLGGARTVWILAEGEQKWLWIINLSGALGNVLLNLMLIPIWGINGAAVASLITQIFANVVMGYIVKEIRPNNGLMVKALNPALMLEAVKDVCKTLK